jgi:hypothetical protein
MDYGRGNIIQPEMGSDLAGPEAPLFMRMAENMPAISHTMAWNVRRFENTMFKGGFLDKPANAINSARKTRRAAKYGSFIGSNTYAPTPSSFMFSKFRGAKAAAAGKTPFIKPSLRTNFSLGGIRRLGSVSGASGMHDKVGLYSPFQGAKMLGKGLEKLGARGALEARGIIDATDEDLLAGGLLGRVSTMQKTASLEAKFDKLETKISKRTAAGKGPGRADRKKARVDKKLKGLDVNIGRLQNVKPVRAPMLPQTPSAALSAQNSIRGNRLRAISDSQGGVLSRRMTESLGTAYSPYQFQGTKSFANLEDAVTKAFRGNTTAASEFLSKTGTSFDDLGRFGDKVARQGPLGRFLPKKSNISIVAKMADEAGEKGAARVLRNQLLKRGGAYALRSASIVGNVALVYDLGKLAGKGVMAAGNFAKDAVKSMQGSMHKPLFGMGFRDNEVAATSRARGVAAIQNSRLNARSMLGSEAGMMAAHFG